MVRHDVALPGAPADLDIQSRVQTAGGEALLSVQVGYPAPDGGGYSGTTRVIAPGGRCRAEGDAVRVTGAAGVLLLTQVNGDGLAGVPTDYPTLLAEHVSLHRAAYGRVSLDLGASPADRARPVGELLARQAASPDRPLAALLEKLFDSGRYLLLAASGLLPPRLTGLWQGDWAAAWGNCLSGNANLNLQLAGAVTTDVPAVVHALAGLVAAQLDDWRVNARRIFGCRGILAPAQADGTDGLCRHFAAEWPHQIWTAGADWLLVPLLDYADSTRADATGDAEFLRTAVLPALTELARFYQDFLAVCDDGGQVVFAPSYSPENQPRGWTGAALNATMDIAAARHALTEAAWRWIAARRAMTGRGAGGSWPAGCRRTRSTRTGRWPSGPGHLAARRCRTTTITGTSATCTRSGRCTRSPRRRPRSWPRRRCGRSGCAARRTVPRTAGCTRRWPPRGCIRPTWPAPGWPR